MRHHVTLPMLLLLATGISCGNTPPTESTENAISNAKQTVSASRTNADKTQGNKNAPATKPKTEKRKKLLRSPDFNAPKGSHYEVTGKLVPQTLYAPSWNLLKTIAKYSWEKLYDKHSPSKTEHATMVKLLSDKRLVGDGIYFDAGYRSDTRGWGLSIYGAPAQGSAYSAILRLYPNGKGVSAAQLKKEFGKPRSETSAGKVSLLTWGNVTALYDEKGKYMGTVFFFKPVKKGK